jgi:hypothetical protein
LGLETPERLYTGNIKGQKVILNYSSLITAKAKYIELVTYFDIGDAGTNSVCWIEVSNTLDNHFNQIRGRSPATAWYSFSESFILPVDSTKTVALQVYTSFPGSNHDLAVYFSGYYVD